MEVGRWRRAREKDAAIAFSDLFQFYSWRQDSTIYFPSPQFFLPFFLPSPQPCITSKFKEKEEGVER